MPTIYFVRHGEVANPNHVCYSDLPAFNLSARGVRQAHATAQHLSGRSIDAVLTSPLARAHQTATAIARRHRLDPLVRKGLVESGQYPGWTGMRWDDIRVEYPTQIESYLDDATTMPDVDETIEEVGARVVAVIDEALADGLASIAVVAHQDPVQAARLVMLGRSLRTLLHDPPEHASVITLVGGPDGTWIESPRWTPPVP